MQGVGFRPFVHRLTLTGLVGNDGRGVWCEVQGADRAVDDFVARLRTDAPPLAIVDDDVVDEISPRSDEHTFTIAHSHADETGVAIDANATRSRAAPIVGRDTP